ncbi:hypothetical protein F5Y15DRAFT_415099 [Xylariaceae sp. FL0016]|nr:hypothetical protein F5Y15DRAFT_415099 [Xylariaceae sp. FL0016]
MTSGQPLTTSTSLACLQATAKSQLHTTFFGKLPLEVREMVYAECWIVSGLKQHVFTYGSKLTHSPCILAEGEVDTRLEQLEHINTLRRGSRLGSRPPSIDHKWASRFTSRWHDHWRCEEAMSEQEGDHGCVKTLFLPVLLTCKQMYIEAFHSLYASIIPVFTDLETAQRMLVTSPSRSTTLLSSLELSLALPYHTLHQHRLYQIPSQCPGPWAELCTTLSNLVRFASLRRVRLRLDLAPSSSSCSSPGDRGPGGANNGANGDDDIHHWWQVRERWVLCAVRGMLARCLTVQLPRVTHLDWARAYQYQDGDETPFVLERYQRLPPSSLLSFGGSAAGSGSGIGSGGIEYWKGRGQPHYLHWGGLGGVCAEVDARGSRRLQRAAEGLRHLVYGLKSG